MKAVIPNCGHKIIVLSYPDFSSDFAQKGHNNNTQLTGSSGGVTSVEPIQGSVIFLGIYLRFLRYVGQGK